METSIDTFAPMRSFVCKVASRCNLDCDYCYLYKLEDQSWRSRDKFMSVETVKQLALRINEHARTHEMELIDITIHGGEPLLAGLLYLNTFCDEMLNANQGVDLRFGMQTNGTLFDEKTLDFCLDRKVSVGLSLDGGIEANDRHRLGFDGASSYENVRAALKLLTSEKGRKVWSGFLAVIDVDNPAKTTYDYLRSYSPPSIEFLLPLGHHDRRPKGKDNLFSTPYADWLLEVFELWYRENPSTVSIRRFRDIIALMLGTKYTSEEWGMLPVDFAVVEVDGQIEAVDTLRATYPGASALGLDVFNNSFDDLSTSSLVLERQNAWSELCDTCVSCEYVKICGGGYFPHRFSAQNRFKNPSVYCEDLKKLIGTIGTVVARDLRSAPKKGTVP